MNLLVLGIQQSRWTSSRRSWNEIETLDGNEALRAKYSRDCQITPYVTHNNTNINPIYFYTESTG